MAGLSSRFLDPCHRALFRLRYIKNFHQGDTGFYRKTVMRNLDQLEALLCVRTIPRQRNHLRTQNVA
jgi:hypothetical protein